MLTPEERAAHAERIEAARRPTPPIPATTRPFVRAWTVDDLAGVALDAERGAGDARRGQRLFAEGACLVCHSFRGEGGRAGPDLTTAARRFAPGDLLRDIIEPSRVINEQYALQHYLLADGRTITGRTVNMAGDTVMIATDPNDPGGSEVRFDIRDLESATPSPLSFMPAGLLDTFTRDEILDLLAWLRSE
jgi:putative heme-binding domain-containing protein